MKQKTNAKEPITIAFDASPLLVNRTGVAYYIEGLVKALSNRYPNDVRLVGFYYNFLGRRSAEHFPQAPNIRYHGSKLIPSKIIYQLRRWNIEIPVEILSHTKSDFNLFTNFLGYPSLFKTPCAPVVHDLTYLDLPDYVARKNRYDLTTFVPKQIKRSNFVVTVSEFSRQKISKQYGISRDDIIVTPIPPQQPVIYDAPTREKALNKLGVKQPFLLFLGTIEPRKNIIKLMRGYLQLPKAIQQKYSLVIVGRIGWNCEAEVAELERAKKEGHNIIHVGYVDNETREILFQTADLFVSASHYEGFGMPVLEAMRYGTPCAVSDIPVFREVADDAAIYFDQDRPAVIADRIQAVLSNESLLKSLGKKGEEHVKTFSWDAIAERLFTRIERTIYEQRYR